MTHSLASLKSSGPTGLMFHHFHGSGHLKSEGSFSAEEFGRSLDHASKVANLLSADVFLEKALNQNLDEADICCSFDDGLQCQFDVAASVLASKKLKAFFFVNTGPHAGHPYILEIFRIFRNQFFENKDLFFAEFDSCLETTMSETFLSAKKTFPEDYLTVYPFYTRSDRWFRYLRDEILTPDEYLEIMKLIIQDHGTSIDEINKKITMSPESITQLATQGHVVGLHSHSHPTNITRLTTAEKHSEYSVNSEYLTSYLNSAPKCMSHPNGVYDEEILRVLREMNIFVGFRDNMDLVSDRSNLEIRRLDSAFLPRD